MNTIFRVNDWKVEEGETQFVITNRSHPEWDNSFSKITFKYRYDWKRVPKQVDRAIRNHMGIFEDIATDRTFGIEIECFHRTEGNIRQLVADKLNSIGISCSVQSYNHNVISTWKIVTDSSIKGGTGLEVVSPILKGQEGIEEVKRVMKILSGLGCMVNKSTGMHVHIGAKDLTSTQLHRAFEFYKQNELLFDSLVANSRREDRQYFCRSLRGFDDFLPSRYSKLNYQAYLKYGTLEFRQHQGSLNGDKAEHWIKLVRAVVEYSKTNKNIRNFGTVETMVKELGLGSEAGWYLERVEELAA